jgi:hypothetical protein
MSDTVPIVATNINDFIDYQLHQYQMNEGVDSLLDYARMFNEAGNYYYLGVGFPYDTPDLTFIPGGSFSSTITVPSFSYLVSVGVYSQNSSGCQIRVYDKGAKADMMYTIFARDANVFVTNNELDIPPEFTGEPVQNFLQSPYIISPPGALQIEITDMTPQGGSNNLIQILLSFAVPVNRESIGVNTVQDIS